MLGGERHLCIFMVAFGCLECATGGRDFGYTISMWLLRSLARDSLVFCDSVNP